MIFGISLRNTEEGWASKFMEGHGAALDEAEAAVLAHYKAVYPGRTYEVLSVHLIDPEPLPCPFCGAAFLSEEDYESVYRDHSGLVSVRCPKCDAHGPPCETDMRAWVAWNVRHTPDVK